MVKWKYGNVEGRQGGKDEDQDSYIEKQE